MLFKRYRPNKDRPSAFTENAKADLLEALAAMTGVEMFIDSAGVHFRRQRPRSQPDFWAEITASDPMSGGVVNRWQYAWTEKVRTGTGWQTKDGGRTGTVSNNFALNSVEANNDGTIEGNSIDHGTNYPAGFEMLPVRGAPIVRMYEEQNSTGGTSYTFAYENAEQGPCEEEE